MDAARTDICQTWNIITKIEQRVCTGEMISLTTDRVSRLEVFCKKAVQRNFAKFPGKHLCQNLFFNKVAALACNFIEKETLAQVFSCELCEISKNTFFTEHLWWLLLKYF